MRIRFTLSYRLILLLSFTIPFIVRLIPEIFFPVAVGFDTAFYVAGPKLGRVDPVFKYRILDNYIYVILYHYVGVDLIKFTKFFGPLLYASTGLGLTFYAWRVLKWDRYRLIMLISIYSFMPPLLRMSWDLYSQSFGTVFLVLMLILLRMVRYPFNYITSALLIILLAYIHSLVLVVASLIYFIEALYCLREYRGIIPILAIIILIPLIPVINPDTNPYRISKGIQASLVGDWPGLDRYDYLIYSLVSIGLLIPAIFLGYIRDRPINTWIISAIIIGLVLILISGRPPFIPHRWVMYSAYPLTLNTVSMLSRRGTLVRYISIILSIVIFSTGLSMLIPGGTIITQLMHEYYPAFPESMYSTTARWDHINALIKFIEYLNGLEDKPCLLTHYPWFYWWAGYLYDGKVIYNGPNYTTIQALRERAEALATRCSELYIIWFTGLTWADEVMVEGDLALYIYRGNDLDTNLA